MDSRQLRTIYSIYSTIQVTKFEFEGKAINLRLHFMGKLCCILVLFIIAKPKHFLLYKCMQFESQSLPATPKEVYGLSLNFSQIFLIVSMSSISKVVLALVFCMQGTALGPAINGLVVFFIIEICSTFRPLFSFEYNNLKWYTQFF